MREDEPATRGDQVAPWDADGPLPAAELRAFLDRGAKLVDGDVVVAFANHGYVDMLLNTIASVRAARPGHEAAVFVLHSATQTALARLGIDSFLVRSRFDPPAEVDSIWSGDWRRIVLNKLDIVAALLALGHGVLYTDIDVFWLRDPFPFFREHGPAGCSLWMQTEDDMLCSGFFYVRPTATTRALFDSRGEDVAGYPRPGDGRVDQPLLDARIRADRDLAYCALPQDLFPDGHTWYRDWRGLRSKAYVVHFNGVTGKPRKIRRMRRYGMWTPDRDAPLVVRAVRRWLSRLG